MQNIVVIDFRSYQPDRAGKGIYTEKITEALLKLDQKFTYILVGQDAPLRFKDYPNLRFIHLKDKGIYAHLELARICQAYHAKYFFSPTSYLAPLFVKKKTKVVLTVHDLVAFLFPKNHNIKATIIEKFTLKRVLKKAYKVATVSHSTKKDLLEFFPDCLHKIITIPCSTSYDLKQPTELLQHQDFFLAVSTIIPRKNYLNLIQAFAKIHRNHPNLKLQIVGKKGWKSKPVLQEIKKLNLQDHVEILGYLSREELIEKYRTAIALVFPSFYEGFGMPPLEAMQAGCPVITSNTSSMPEVTGDAAIHIDPHNVEQISQAMELIFNNSEKRSQLISEGFEQAKKFSWEKSARSLLEIFHAKENNESHN